MEEMICLECGSKQFDFDESRGESICNKCGMIDDNPSMVHEYTYRHRSKLKVGESTIGNIPKKYKKNMSVVELKQCPDVRPESRLPEESRKYNEDMMVEEAIDIMKELDIAKILFMDDVISTVRKCFKENCFNGVSSELTILAIINGIRLARYKRIQKDLIDSSESKKYNDFMKSSCDFMESFDSSKKIKNITNVEIQRLESDMIQNVQNAKSFLNFEIKGRGDETNIQKLIIKKIKDNPIYSWDDINSRTNFLMKKGIVKTYTGIATWHESNNFLEFDSKYEDVLEKNVEFYEKILGGRCILKNASKIKKINEELPYYALAISLVFRKKHNTGMTCATLFYLLKEHEEYTIPEFKMSQNDFISFWGISNKQFKKENLPILRRGQFLENSHNEFLEKMNNF